MADPRDSAPEPLTRAERQQQTRAALIEAARVVFARDGFHGASLDTIAREAGLSKGAVYSNFDSKADLFLAVMDTNLAHLEDWDPIARWEVMGDLSMRQAMEHAGLDADQNWGFALATLEFAAHAGRDPDVSAALGQRLRRVAAAFERVVEPRRSDTDPLPTDELATLLTALDQGASLLALGGWVHLDGDMVRRGMLRLLRPVPDEDDRSAADES